MVSGLCLLPSALLTCREEQADGSRKIVVDYAYRSEVRYPLSIVMDEGLPIVPGYEVLEPLAAGGRAEIYLAKDRTQEGQLVAVKFLKKEDIDDVDKVQAFMDEVELTKLLVHPTIVRVFHGEFTAGLPYLVMEFVDGITVYELVARARRLKKQVPFGVAAYVGAMVADALGYAHSMPGPDGEPLNLVHRDVSAVNIMITFDGAVKLLDFGIARSKISSVRTAPGIIKGKLDYLSPEQCTGGEIDALTDIYSLGVVLYEIVTGRRPFEETSLGRQFEKVSKGDRPKVHKLRPDVPPRLERIIDRAMAVKRKRRYPSAKAMHEDIRAFMEKLPERPTSSFMAHTLKNLVPEQLTKVQEAYGPSNTTAVNEAEVVADLLKQKQEGPPTASPGPASSYPPPFVSAVPEEEPDTARSQPPPPPPGAMAADTLGTVSPLATAPPAQKGGRDKRRIGMLVALAVMVIVAVALGALVVRIGRWVTSSSDDPVHATLGPDAAVQIDAQVVSSPDTGATGVPAVVSDARPNLDDGAPTWPDAGGIGDAEPIFDGAIDGEFLDFTLPDGGGDDGVRDADPIDERGASKGFLTVTSRRKAALFVRGKRMGLTPVKRLELAPGRYRIKIRSRYGLRRQWVRIKAGREERVRFNL